MGWKFLVFVLAVCLISLISFSFVSAIDCSSISGCSQVGNDLVCQFGSTGAEDGSLSQQGSTWAYYGELRSGCDTTTKYEAYYKIKSLVGLPTNPSSVRLELWDYRKGIAVTGNEYYISEVDESWSESTLETSQRFLNTKPSQININYLGLNNWDYVDITPFYNNWESANNGLAIKSDADCSADFVTWWRDSDYTASFGTMIPKLIFSGVCTDAEEDGEEGISSEDETEFSIESGSICKESGWIWL